MFTVIHHDLSWPQPVKELMMARRVVMELVEAKAAVHMLAASKIKMRKQLEGNLGRRNRPEFLRVA